MAHAYSQNVLHIVFSTKDRSRLIAGEFQHRMWAYVVGVCKNNGILVNAIGGGEDHIHLLVQIPPTMPLSKAINVVKSNSSRWANEQIRHLAWQDGYVAFSVIASNVPAVLRYIQSQESHHRKMSFDVEFLALLKKHGAEYDPKFVFG